MSMEVELGKLICLMNPYSQTMEFPFHLALQGNTEQQGIAEQQGTNLAKFQVEIDNYQGEWQFKGNMQKVERALRITYRYPVLDAEGNPNGLWATEHLLIGYAGGNGS